MSDRKPLVGEDITDTTPGSPGAADRFRDHQRDATIRAQLALEISNAILAARADDIGDGYQAGARIREQDAAIARQLGGVDPLEEFK